MITALSDRTHGRSNKNDLRGKERAAALRNSGKVPWQPCPITGSEEEHMKIWFVPISWNSSTSADVKTGEVSNSNIGSLEDMRALNAISHVKAAEAVVADEDPGATIKAEPRSPISMEEQEQADMENFIANVQPCARRLLRHMFSLKESCVWKFHTATIEYSRAGVGVIVWLTLVVYNSKRAWGAQPPN